MKQANHRSFLCSLFSFWLCEWTFTKGSLGFRGIAILFPHVLFSRPAKLRRWSKPCLLSIYCILLRVTLFWFGLLGPSYLRQKEGESQTEWTLSWPLGLGRQVRSWEDVWKKNGLATTILVMCRYCKTGKIIKYKAAYTKQKPSTILIWQNIGVHHKSKALWSVTVIRKHLCR